jgi:hypothetical protein
MKVALYPSDTGGCGTYRIINPAQALLKLGYDIELVLPEAPAEYQIRAQWFLADEPGSEPEIVDVDVPEADVVVLQRPMRANIVRCIEILQARACVSWSSSTTTWPTSAPATATARSIRASHRSATGSTCCTPARSPTSSPSRRRSWPRSTPRTGASSCCATSSRRLPGDRGRPARRHLRRLVGLGRDAPLRPADDRARRRLGADQDRGADGDRRQRRRRAQGAAVRRVVACGYMPLEQYPVALAQFDVGIVPLEAGTVQRVQVVAQGPGDGLRRRAVRGDTDRRVFTPGSPRGRPAGRATEPVGGLRQEARP